ncbi:uncharacterized protein LOC143514192 isoform X2 [Brachyhypopomus gauderio]
MATGSRRRNDKGRWVATVTRHESLRLCERLRVLRLQHQRELARVCRAQLELQGTLERLSRPGPPARPAPSLSRPVPVGVVPPRRRVQPCCPNHIVCSSCNLRLRLADSLTRRFTPGLWTMYCRSEDGASRVYPMPPFVERRNLSISDNSLRYLPFV